MISKEVFACARTQLTAGPICTLPPSCDRQGFLGHVSHIICRRCVAHQLSDHKDRLRIASHADPQIRTRGSVHGNTVQPSLRQRWHRDRTGRTARGSGHARTQRPTAKRGKRGEHLVVVLYTAPS